MRVPLTDRIDQVETQIAAMIGLVLIACNDGDPLAALAELADFGARLDVAGAYGQHLPADADYEYLRRQLVIHFRGFLDRLEGR